MRIDAIPIWAVFAGTIVVVMVAIEAGYLLGQAVHRRSEDEKESPVSAIASAILGLAAFMLAFTFGIVSERHDAKRALVRDDAVALRTAWQRSDFLPDTDRAQAAAWLRQYEVNGIHASRVAVGIQARVPSEIWLVLYGITMLGMLGVGYQTGIAGSKRSMARPILALSFALVFALIASLDRPDSGVMKVTQQPLIDLRDSMAAAAGRASRE
jgi:hypothetical protein